MLVVVRDQIETIGHIRIDIDICRSVVNAWKLQNLSDNADDEQQKATDEPGRTPRFPRRVFVDSRVGMHSNLMFSFE